MADKSAALSFRIEPDLKAEIVRLAKQDHRTVASFVVKMLVAHIATQPK